MSNTKKRIQPVELSHNKKMKIEDKKTIMSIPIHDIIACDVLKPKFKSKNVYESNGIFFLDDDNCLIIQNDVLDPNALSGFLKKTCNTRRKSEKVGWNYTPRYEVCYTINGSPYKYSGKNKYTTKFPSHVSNLVPIFLRVVDEALCPKKNKYNQLSNAVDILYHSDLKGGGSISAHKDDELTWGLVIIFSLGQTRWLRVRHEETKEWHNVKMQHNSLVCMYGKTFQQYYTHQVDKLNIKESIHHRISLNIRFLE